MTRAAKPSDTTLVAGAVGRYATVSIIHRVSFPAAEVWAIVRDWGNQEVGKGLVERVTTSGEGIGSTRTLHIAQAAGGGSVTERLDARDEAEMCLAYSIIDYGPVPLAEYSGRFRVTSTGPASSELAFEARLLPKGIEPNDASAISISNMTIYLANLDRLLCASRSQVKGIEGEKVDC